MDVVRGNAQIVGVTEDTDDRERWRTMNFCSDSSTKQGKAERKRKIFQNNIQSPPII